ncbi:acyltransferase [Pseudoalteromonas sp. SR41-4]|uniref:acyltransferase n=1 Tax=Pseudoalteromonas sp. SR41-4 TaxID=2760950 RepID=UPI0016040349|nr:acyltransferase [Pseudoalteromonas sp. SR41-4]MBB1295376.1 acyltransferase [Pseudoalteromonas sp. SR41-4]
MKHKMLLLYSWLVRTFFIFLPDIPVIMRLRGWLYSFGMRSADKNLQVSANSKLVGLENLKFGKDVYIASNVVINASCIINIEDEVMIGIASILVSGDHTMKDESYRYGKPIRKPIFIGRGSWVAGNTLITAGGSLPHSSLLAGGAVLSKKFDEPGIYGGVPAKLVRKN